MNEKLFMSQAGYDKEIIKLKELKAKFDANEKEMSEAIIGAIGDGWHDNALFDELLRKENMIANMINAQNSKIRRIEVIEIFETNNDTVGIGDLVGIHLYIDGELDILDIKLLAEESDEDDTASINSPLGKEIIYKKVNQEFAYIVGSTEIKGEIVSIKKSNQLVI